jgi:uncharacterized protein (TIGR00369 family)
MTDRAQRLPRDPEFEARVRASFERQRFMELLGARLSTIEPGVVEIELPVADELTQQNRFLHAGALLAALDTACGYAAMTLMPARAEVLTVELKSNLLAPVRSGILKARGEVLRAGRVLTVCQGDAFEVVRDEPTHVATMLATMITRDEDPAAPRSADVEEAG